MIGEMDTRTDVGVITASLTAPSSFAEIFERHFVSIHGYLARRVGTAGADDLAAEVFRIAFEQRSRFDPQCDSAAPWLFGIATNLAARWFRSSARRDRAYERLFSRALGNHDEYSDADSRLDASTETRQLGVALDALADGDRDALLLYAWEHLKYDEIALALGIPVGTVRSRIFRARRIVRELLEPCGQLPGDPTKRGGRRG